MKQAEWETYIYIENVKIIADHLIRNAQAYSS